MVKLVSVVGESLVTDVFARSMIGRGGPVRKEMPVKAAVGSDNGAFLTAGAPDRKSVNLPVWVSASIRQGRRLPVKSLLVNSQRTGQRLVDPLSSSISRGALPALLVNKSKDTATFVFAGKT